MKIQKISKILRDRNVYLYGIKCMKNGDVTLITNAGTISAKRIAWKYPFLLEGHHGNALTPVETELQSNLLVTLDVVLELLVPSSCFKISWAALNIIT